MTPEERKAAIELKARTVERLQRVRAAMPARYTDAMRATDARMEAYVLEVIDHPERHNLYELLQIGRFFDLLDKYEWRAGRVRRFIRFYEALRFNGTNEYSIVMAGTAFPGASTYEVSVRPAEIGREMGIVGSGNNQISIDLLADGRVRAARRSENEGVAGAPRKGAFVDRKVVSEARLEPGKWTKLQVVYDLRKLRLYVNGAVQGEIDSAPIANHEWETHLIFGAKCSWVYNPKAHFKGDIRGIRVYGRNLSPSEFLK